MAIEVTLRHATLSEGAKTYAEGRAKKLINAFPKIENIHVIIDRQHDLYEAEFVIQRKGKPIVGTKEHASNFRSVIDTAAARAEKQIRKLHAKVQAEHIRNVEHRNV